MEAFFGVVVIVGVVVWIFGRSSNGRDGPAAIPRRGPPVAPMLPPSPMPPAPAASDDAAFFDGYIWGRLQERHDERQHGPASGHDHDMFDGDDCFDDGD
jgi:hypothetical protein